MTTQSHRERVLRHLSRPSTLLEALRRSAEQCDYERGLRRSLRCPNQSSQDEEEEEFARFAAQQTVMSHSAQRR
jgi:hypothetical protein